MSGENSLPFFHGALLDDDVDKMLELNGDFLLQTKFEQSKKKNKLVLAVKHGHRTIRIPISRLEKGYRIFVSVKITLEIFKFPNETIFRRKFHREKSFQYFQFFHIVYVAILIPIFLSSITLF